MLLFDILKLFGLTFHYVVAHFTKMEGISGVLY